MAAVCLCFLLEATLDEFHRRGALVNSLKAGASGAADSATWLGALGLVSLRLLGLDLLAVSEQMTLVATAEALSCRLAPHSLLLGLGQQMASFKQALRLMPHTPTATTPTTGLSPPNRRTFAHRVEGQAGVWKGKLECGRASWSVEGQAGVSPSIELGRPTKPALPSRTSYRSAQPSIA
eukprot:362137-Chlamydomonas_euryale.AAC.2